MMASTLSDKSEGGSGGGHIFTTNTLPSPDLPEGGLNSAVVLVIAGFAILILLAITCGIIRLCRKDDADRTQGLYSSGPAYSVAVSNRLFKDVGGDVKEQLPCLNCRLIEMGEMACYQDRCPQCGQIPPGKKPIYETFAVDPSNVGLLRHARQPQHQPITAQRIVGAKINNQQDSNV